MTRPLLVGTVAAIAAFGIGYWLDLLTPYFYLFLAVYFLRVAYWDRWVRENPGASGFLVRGGQQIFLGLYVVISLYTALRIAPQLWVMALVFVGFCLVGWFALKPLVTEGQETGKVMQWLCVLGRPALVGWLVASFVYWPLGLLLWPPSPQTADIQTVAQQREDIKRAQAPDVTIAVALSGGGYRAASIHTGVLKALTEREIPIDYLTTVSGGSIIGAYYALGRKPDEFERLLMKKPGLPNDIAHVFFFLGGLVCPWWNDSDTYARHFARTYFGDTPLSQVVRPTLLVNATNYRARARTVFWGAPTTSWSDVRIADAVAASGAFPGAFEPKRIRDQYYIDGGVEENLGLEGLREFLKDKTREKPDILIISDASKGDAMPTVGHKMFRFNLLKEASSTSYQALHMQLYRIYTDNEYDPDSDRLNRQPYAQWHAHIYGEGASHEKSLYVFVLDGTSTAERSYMREQQVARFGPIPPGRKPMAEAVAGISTLKELDQEELQQGVWVGETVANKYRNSVLCTIREIRKARAAHSEVWPKHIRETCGVNP
jgi:predicted acylesterase/phospholipase RssA